MARIELRSVGLQIGENTILSDLSICVQEGEFLTLLGPSGCGKSTTLNIVAGLLEPTTGDVLIDGHRVNGLAPRDRRVAMVFQDYALYPHMTVFENLSFPLKAVKLPDREIHSRVAGVAGTLGIEALMQRLPKALSGGQRQRVALGRALVREPRAFLMDEPLSNLDARLRVAMRAELKRLHQQVRTTVIYVTHDQAEAMTLSNRVAVLREGVLQQVGTPREVYENPANQFVASFVGALGMNFVVCRPSLKDGRLVLSRDEFTLATPPSVANAFYLGREQNVVVGLRPEHISVARPEAAECFGTVEVVEYLGSENLAHLNVGDARLVARVSPEFEAQPGSRVGLRFDTSRACLFDDRTGKLIPAAGLEEVAPQVSNDRDIVQADGNIGAAAGAAVTP